MIVKRMTLAQVKAYVRKHGTWDGFMIGSKMRFSLDNAARLHLTAKKDAIKDFDADIIDSVTNKAFVTTYNAWAYYNTNYEQGYYAHYYMIIGE